MEANQKETTLVQELVENQGKIATFGVVAGVVLAGMNVTSNEELNKRHDEFNNKFTTVLDNLDKSSEKEASDNLIMIGHAGLHVFDFIDYINVSIEGDHA
ncbi:hypothetical protein D3P96_02820 [Weissella viridescens]|uniref:Uncharacterized protein n=1 Tax=Weissella viridescens TaxID=1629 RepID=A0A3P2RL93_WEIVI|nr:hypothetical protein [Weissella viridescens]RRG18238.1 hypothetical protein D3P96_02820 [Weissella viridescens]